MKVYVLLTAYPYEGGHVHGVFTTREKAQKALDSEEFYFGHEYTEIREIGLNQFEFQGIIV